MAFRPAKGRPEPATGPIRRLDALARAAFPAAATALLMVLAAAPRGVPSLLPAIALCSVFFWSLFRPAALPAPVAFALGLLHDLLAFSPLGIGVLMLVLLHAAVLRLRRFLARQSFLLVWLAFCGFAAVAAALGFALQGVLGWRLPPVMPALTLFGLSAGLYPLLAWAMTRIHKAMERAEALA